MRGEKKKQRKVQEVFRGMGSDFVMVEGEGILTVKNKN